MSGLFSALPVNVQEAHGYMRAIQQCSTDLYRTAVTSSYCVSYRRLAIYIFMAIQNGLGRGQIFFENQERVNILECSVTFYEYKNVFLMLVD